MKRIIISAMFCLLAMVAVAQPPQDSARGQRGPADKSPFFMDQLFKRFMVKGYAQGGYTYLEKDERNPRPTFINTPNGTIPGPPTFSDANYFDVKRAYVFCRAQITDRWYFWFMYDFCGIVNEYYLDFAAIKGGKLNLRMGAFKHPYGLENPYSPTKQELIDVYSQATVYLAGCGSDLKYGTQYGRDMGLLAYGDIANKHLHYELGILNGQGVSSSRDRNNKKDVVARLEVLPSNTFKIVASGQTGYGNALAQTQYTPNIAAGEDYKRHRWAFGAEYKSTGHINNIADYWHVRPLVIRAEYLGGKDGNNPSEGAYVTVGIPIAKTWDFVATYDYFNYNKDLAGTETTKYVAGFQYWFYKQCRLQAQYIYTDSNGLIGSYSTVMLQTQFSF